MRGLLLARVGRGDTFSTQRRFGNRFAVWLRRLRFHLMMEKGRQAIANMSLISRQQQDLPHTVTTKTDALLPGGPCPGDRVACPQMRTHGSRSNWNSMQSPSEGGGREEGEEDKRI